jgi:hypothetical protein
MRVQRGATLKQESGLFHPGDGSIKVALTERVLSHIQETVVGAGDVEDGGKLLGHATKDGSHVDVLAAIPSGPAASRSATHLHPDGAFQEAAFRVVEMAMPSIEHVGTWHSHHCNGLPHLSDGDVRGYVKTVRDQRYHSSLFVALLVIRKAEYSFAHWIQTRGLKVYALRKGSDAIFELDPLAITIVTHGVGEPVSASVAEEGSGLGDERQRQDLTAALAVEERWFRRLNIESKTTLRHNRVVRRFAIGDVATGVLLHDDAGRVVYMSIDPVGLDRMEVRDDEGLDWRPVLIRLLGPLRQASEPNSPLRFLWRYLGFLQQFVIRG